MVPFSMTLSDPIPRFQGHRVTTDAIDVLCAQLTRDLFCCFTAYDSCKYASPITIKLLTICSESLN